MRSLRRTISTLAAMIVVADLALGGEPSPPPWVTSQKGLPDLSGSAYGAGMYVAAGANGTIYSSRNGTTWTERGNPDKDKRWIGAVVYARGQFVAVGSYSPTGTPIILTSPNGIQWKLRKTTAEVDLSSVVYGRGRYVAVGYSYVVGGGVVLTSLNGIQWTQASIPSTQGELKDVAWGGGTFVAVGSNRAVLTSPDGENWTLQAEPPTVSSDINSVSHDGHQFIAVTGDQILTSPDGVSWQIASPLLGNRSAFYSVNSGRGISLIVGWNALLYSTDGATWQVALDESRLAGRALNTAVIGRTRAVALGSSGTVFTSPDGSSWTSATASASRKWTDVAYNGSEFCAVGASGEIASSPDGTTFTNHTGPADPDGQGFTVAHGGDSPGVFVAVGRSGIHVSQDCVSFEAVDFLVFRGTLPRDVVYGNMDSRFVIVGRGSAGPLIASSPDGVTWTLQDAPPTTDYSYLESVSYGDGRFVAMGAGNNPPRPLLYTSEDGIEWTAQSVPFQSYERLERFEFAGGVFLASGHWTVWKSLDGIQWTAHSAPFRFDDFAFGDGRFVGVGWFGTVAVSAEGETWVPQAGVSRRDLRGLVFSETLHRFVAVGDSVILRTDDPVLAFEQDRYTVKEGTPTRTMTVRRTGSLASAVSFDYGTQSGSAGGTDYLPKEGRLVIPAGRSKVTLSIPIRNDSLAEDEEDFGVELSNPSEGAFLGINKSALAIIQDDDDPGTIVLARDSFPVTEGRRALTVKIPLLRTGKAPLASGVTVTLATTAGTALPGEDYTEVNQVVTFPAGATRAFATITILPDAIDESDESFGVMLVGTSGGGRLGVRTNATILVKDAP